MVVVAKRMALFGVLFLLVSLVSMGCILRHKYLQRQFAENLQMEILTESLKKETRNVMNSPTMPNGHTKVDKNSKLNALDLSWVGNFERHSLSPVSRSEINYADELLGAYIEQYEAILARPRILLDWFGIINEENAPEELIRGNMQPGACFAFKQKQKAVVTIVLAEPIYIEALELQHISKYVSPSKSTENAPRHFSVYAIYAEENMNEAHLGDFEFENIAPYQIFPANSAGPCRKIRVKFTSNHGHPEVTCVYKLAVYGRSLKNIEHFNNNDFLT